MTASSHDPVGGPDVSYRRGVITSAAPAVRWLWALAPALTMLLLPTVNGPAGAAVLGSAIALLVAAVVVADAHGRSVRSLFTASSNGPVRSERCLRGSFRRQSSPDTPGRPLPRAPGSELRPA